MLSRMPLPDTTCRPQAAAFLALYQLPAALGSFFVNLVHTGTGGGCQGASTPAVPYYNVLGLSGSTMCSACLTVQCVGPVWQYNV